MKKVGSATILIIKTSFPDSENFHKSCKIEQLELETGNILTKMEASTTMLRRIQSFYVQHNAECLAMAHALGSYRFPGLLEPAGFKLCDCKRVQEQEIHFCMALPTPTDRTVATVGAEIRANAVASEKGEDTISMVSPKSGLAQAPEPSEQSGGQPGQESEAPVQSSALRNPSQPRHHGTGTSRLASQEATDTDGMIAQGLVDDTAEKATASRTIPIRSRPTTKNKKYCSYWIRNGECDYTQTGCKYKHEMPVDEEAFLDCGLRGVPRWFMESPQYEAYLQKKGEPATGRLARVSTEENVTSTAESSRQSSGRRGENAVRSRGAGRTLMTPTTSRDARQLVTHGLRSPYDSYHQSIIHPQPDAKSARNGPPSDDNSNATDGAAVQQLEGQTYKPAGATASSNDFSIRAAAEGSSKIKDEDVEKLPRRQARNNGGSSIAAGTPHLRQFKQALRGSGPADNSAGSTMGAGKKGQLSRPEPDADDQGAR